MICGHEGIRTTGTTKAGSLPEKHELAGFIHQVREIEPDTHHLELLFLAEADVFAQRQSDRVSVF